MIALPNIQDQSPNDLAHLFSLVDHEETLWDPDYLQEIGRQPFLLHAIEALYLSKQQYFESGNKAAYQHALIHNIEASSIFRHSMSTVSEHNWFGQLVFALSVVIFHTQVTRDPHRYAVLETMYVLRSAAEFGKVIQPFFLRSQIPALIEPHLKHYSSTDDPIMLSAVASLDAMISGMSWTSEMRAVYSQDLVCLREWIVSNQGHPQTWVHFLSWPSNASSMYMALLAQKDTVALMMFIHWCAIMRYGPSRWFLDGWASALAKQAFQFVDPEARRLLSWPQAVLQL